MCINVRYLLFSSWLTSLHITGCMFIHLIRAHSNVFFCLFFFFYSWTQCGKERVGRIDRVAWKHIHYRMWNKQPVGICCMTQRAQIRCSREVGWGGSWELEGRFKSRRTYVCLWLIHVDVWQRPTQYGKAIILQWKINLKKFKLLCFKGHCQESEKLKECEKKFSNHILDGV